MNQKHFFLVAAPREFNKRSWLYRIRPSVLHDPYQKNELGYSPLNWEQKQREKLKELEEDCPNPNQVIFYIFF